MTVRANQAAMPGHSRSRPGVLLPFVLLSFAANTPVTGHVVRNQLLDAGLLSAVRFNARSRPLDSPSSDVSDRS